MYIGDYLGRREIYSPDKLAIIHPPKSPELRLTFQQWNRRANRLANWLRDGAGVCYRDRVAILAQDGVEHLDLFHACAKLGAIHTARGGGAGACRSTFRRCSASTRGCRSHCVACRASTPRVEDIS